MSDEPNPYAPPAATEEALPEPAPEVGYGPRGIGGWLILPLLGLVGSLLSLSVALFTVYAPLFAEGGGWAVVTDQSDPSYSALWAPLIVFEIGTNLALIGLIVFLLYLVFRKSRRFPRLMIAYLIAGIVVGVIDLAWAEQIPALAADSSSESLTQVMRSIVGAVIWIPYFLVSQRVKNTFVEP
jgi:hypothetical protein